MKRHLGFTSDLVLSTSCFHSHSASPIWSKKQNVGVGKRNRSERRNADGCKPKRNSRPRGSERRNASRLPGKRRNKMTFGGVCWKMTFGGVCWASRQMQARMKFVAPTILKCTNAILIKCLDLVPNLSKWRKQERRR